jgi:6-phosphofructokinase 2
LVPEQKIRCQTPLFDAGGGGINVSKAISRLEGKSLCSNNFWRIDRRNAEKALQEESISLKPLKRSGTRENLQLMTTILSFVLFSRHHHNR